MKNIKIIGLAWFFIGWLSQAQAMDQAARLKLMDKEMSCLENNKTQALSWNDVCVLPDNSVDSVQNNMQSSPKDAVLEGWNTYSNISAPLIDTDLFKPIQYELGTEFSYIDYREHSLAVKDHGPFYGLYGDLDLRPDEDRSWLINVFHADMHVNAGDDTYKSPDGELDSIPDFIFEPRIWAGRDVTVFDDSRITPYIGLGYRFLYDHFGKYSDAGGYDRFANYLYAPVGVQFVTDAVTGWRFGLDLEYDVFIQGWMYTELSDLNEGFPNIANTQHKGYGMRASVDIVKKMHNFNVVITPYIRYWNISQSVTKYFLNTDDDVLYYGYEPHNTSTEVGMKLGVQF